MIFFARLYPKMAGKFQFFISVKMKKCAWGKTVKTKTQITSFIKESVNFDQKCISWSYPNMNSLFCYSDYYYSWKVWFAHLPLKSTSHCTKVVVQTNLPRMGMLYIFWRAMMSTFTWAMPYKLISVCLIT